MRPLDKNMFREVGVGEGSKGNLEQRTGRKAGVGRANRPIYIHQQHKESWHPKRRSRQAGSTYEQAVL